MLWQFPIRISKRSRRLPVTGGSAAPQPARQVSKKKTVDVKTPKPREPPMILALIHCLPLSRSTKQILIIPRRRTQNHGEIMQERSIKQTMEKRSRCVITFTPSPAVPDSHPTFPPPSVRRSWPSSVSSSRHSARATNSSRWSEAQTLTPPRKRTSEHVHAPARAASALTAATKPGCRLPWASSSTTALAAKRGWCGAGGSRTVAWPLRGKPADERAGSPWRSTATAGSSSTTTVVLQRIFFLQARKMKSIDDFDFNWIYSSRVRLCLHCDLNSRGF